MEATCREWEDKLELPIGDEQLALDAIAHLLVCGGGSGDGHSCLSKAQPETLIQVVSLERFTPVPVGLQTVEIESGVDGVRLAAERDVERIGERRHRVDLDRRPISVRSQLIHALVNEGVQGRRA